MESFQKRDRVLDEIQEKVEQEMRRAEHPERRAGAPGPARATHVTASPPTSTATATAFRELGLIEPLVAALTEQECFVPTPMQAQLIPSLLRGRDLLGCMRTDAGKTAIIVLPILQRLSQPEPRVPSRSPRALVLVATRERAVQVVERFVTFGRHLRPTVAAIHGGVGQGLQVQALARGVDLLVATPARLLDLMIQRHARLDRLEVVVLDEVDQMLDLGFLPMVRRLLATMPKRRQTLLFSATMPPTITSFAEGILRQPVKVSTPSASTMRARMSATHLLKRGAGRERRATPLSVVTQ